MALPLAVSLLNPSSPLSSSPYLPLCVSSLPHFVCSFLFPVYDILFRHICLLTTPLFNRSIPLPPPLSLSLSFLFALSLCHSLSLFLFSSFVLSGAVAMKAPILQYRNSNNSYCDRERVG